jgi:hypothetical protein
MENYKDFNGSPRMPGLGDDFGDFDNAVGSGSFGPTQAYNDLFGFNLASGSSSGFDPATLNLQTFPSSSLEYGTYTATAPVPPNLGANNDMACSTGAVYEDGALQLTPLTALEYQAVMALRAQNQRSTQNGQPLVPTPSQDFTYDPSFMDYQSPPFDHFEPCHPHASVNSMESPGNWERSELAGALATPLGAPNADSQSS